MVLVDTSIWISLFRKEKSGIGQKIWALVAGNEAAICGQIWVEYIGGFRKEAERRRHAQALKSFPFIEETRSAFEKAADLLADYPFLGPGDAIIAATAMTSKIPLFTLDKDFSPIRTEGLLLLG